MSRESSREQDKLPVTSCQLADVGLSMGLLAGDLFLPYEGGTDGDLATRGQPMATRSRATTKLATAARTSQTILLVIGRTKNGPTPIDAASANETFPPTVPT